MERRLDNAGLLQGEKDFAHAGILKAWGALIAF